MEAGTSLDFSEVRPNSSLIGILCAVGFVSGVALSVAACVIAENGYPFLVALAYLLPILVAVLASSKHQRWAAILAGVFFANLIGAPVTMYRSGKLDHIELLMSSLGAALYGVAGLLFLWKGPLFGQKKQGGILWT
eukprot:TRINITY_DN3336_c0_g1_i17.p1 TRINITY_DN3336_c0_g1~~TRINITY_DN3336_c0_g1_i17.p1  ORF type:complete len:136 (-),score=20.84 TRINITY_DN3336_c0_g1_i17:577-984(-)